MVESAEAEETVGLTEVETALTGFHAQAGYGLVDTGCSLSQCNLDLAVAP